jgi:hypothetical protein
MQQMQQMQQQYAQQQAQSLQSLDRADDEDVAREQQRLRDGYASDAALLRDIDLEVCALRPSSCRVSCSVPSTG